MWRSVVAWKHNRFVCGHLIHKLGEVSKKYENNKWDGCHKVGELVGTGISSLAKAKALYTHLSHNAVGCHGAIPKFREQPSPAASNHEGPLQMMNESPP